MASRSGIAVLVIFGLVAVAVSDGGCEPGDDTGDSLGDGDGELDLDFDADTVSTCDGVVVVETASGSVSVPGDTSLFGSDDSPSCALRQGDDGDGVRALQTALARCNGQPITVDGEYGDATTRAVANVQGQRGVAVDGTFGPATLQVMRWPLADGGCAGGVTTSSRVIDEAS